jgi:uncharacterized protein (TIGR02118 family)
MILEKLILFVKRKSGISHEEFRQHYESCHAPLAWSKLSGKLVKYKRNYLSSFPGLPEPIYDCITEFWFADKEALDGALTWTRSEAGQILAQDEEKFMERPTMLTYFASEADLHE